MSMSSNCRLFSSLPVSTGTFFSSSSLPVSSESFSSFSMYSGSFLSLPVSSRDFTAGFYCSISVSSRSFSLSVLLVRVLWNLYRRVFFPLIICLLWVGIIWRLYHRFYSSLSNSCGSLPRNSVNFRACIFFTAGLAGNIDPSIDFSAFPPSCLALLLYAISFGQYSLIFFHLLDTKLQ